MYFETHKSYSLGRGEVQFFFSDKSKFIHCIINLMKQEKHWLEYSHKQPTGTETTITSCVEKTSY